jgi:hypothetical protein
MRKKNWVFLVVTLVLLAVSACSASTAAVTETPAASPTVAENLPEITSADLDKDTVAMYESIEMALALAAEYENPYDAREVQLNGTFTGPDGAEMTVPGFWDGEEAWRIRFTPSSEGEWQYRLSVTDQNGTSQPFEGTFDVIASDRHGWLQVGSWVDPAFSSQYLVHHDGTPFYGIGHCDALNILTDGFDAERGVLLFDNMVAAGENFVVWWPVYSNSPINNSYSDYTVSNLTLIDLILRDAQKKGVY